MRILVFSHEYPPIGGGGGKVAQDLCRGLAARGHEVRVLTAHLGNLPHCESQEGLEIDRLESGRREAFRADLKAMAGYMWASYRAGLEMIREWQPDVLHVHFAVPGGPVAWALQRATGVPYVLTAHLGDVPGGTPEKTGKWFRWVYPFTPTIWRSAARVVAVSEFTRRLALRHYPVPIQVIHNGVDLNALDPGEISVGDPPRLVFAGRFVQQKNPLQLVQALAELRDLPWTCAMLGDGPLRSAADAEINRLELRERFILPGWVPPEQVVRQFADSDILCMPSLSEGLPVVGVQAAAMGLAMVVSRVGGWLDIVEPGVNGFLLEPDDRSGFVDALRLLLSDHPTLLSYRRASRVLASRFDIDKIVTDYEDVLVQARQTRRVPERNASPF